MVFNVAESFKGLKRALPSPLELKHQWAEISRRRVKRMYAVPGIFRHCDDAIINWPSHAPAPGYVAARQQRLSRALR